MPGLFAAEELITEKTFDSCHFWEPVRWHHQLSLKESSPPQVIILAHAAALSPSSAARWHSHLSASPPSAQITFIPS